MAVISLKGLFDGKRLRKCSRDTRLFWPYLYLMANGYARMELDLDTLAEGFASFKADAPTTNDIAAYIEEYKANHLLFVYDHKGQQWAQWDTPRSHTRDYKTADDRRSPEPPEPNYTDWLKEQHGEDWKRNHWNAKVADSTIKLGSDYLDSSMTLGQTLPEILPSLDQNLPVGVGVGVGVGIEPLSEHKPSDVLTASPSRKKKPKKDSDPRHMSVRKAYMEAWSAFNSNMECPWKSGEAGLLGQLLAGLPKWSVEDFERAIKNLFQSVDFHRQGDPKKHIPKLAGFFKAPQGLTTTAQATPVTRATVPAAKMREMRAE